MRLYVTSQNAILRNASWNFNFIFETNRNYYILTSFPTLAIGARHLQPRQKTTTLKWKSPWWTAKVIRKNLVRHLNLKGGIRIKLRNGAILLEQRWCFPLDNFASFHYSMNVSTSRTGITDRWVFPCTSSLLLAH